MTKLLLYTSNSLSMTYLSAFETHTVVKRGEGLTFLLSRSGGIDDGVNPFGLYFELGFIASAFWFTNNGNGEIISGITIR